MIALLKRVAGRRNAVRLGVALAVLVWIGKFWEERRKVRGRERGGGIVSVRTIYIYRNLR
jgi:hypothetical protein